MENINGLKNVKNAKILVFTITPWSSVGEANTWGALLDGHPSENIANIYLRDGYPEEDRCASSLCISEDLVVKSIVRRWIKTAEVRKVSQDTDKTVGGVYARPRKKRRYGLLFLRELFWKLGKWRSRELKDFVDDFKPDIILHSLDNYIYKNRIARYVAKRTGARMIGYVWDDTFTYKQSDSFWHKVYRFFQRKSNKKTAKKLCKLFAISPKTKAEADVFFKTDTELLTKPLCALSAPCDYSDRCAPYKMVYTGNLAIGRDRTLKLVSEAISRVNSDGEKITLDVYTQTKLADANRTKIESEFCRIHPPVSQADVQRIQNESDVLLFVEDFGEESKKARLSFSTKITDYLSAGKCIFAVGSEDIAPIDYFINEECAAVATSADMIESALRSILEDGKMKRLAQKASEVGRKNHDPEQIKDRFNKAIAENM